MIKQHLARRKDITKFEIFYLNVVVHLVQTGLNKGAFDYCSKLTNITIPASVNSFGARAFEGCSKLQTVYYGETAEQWNSMSIDGVYYNRYLIDATRYYYSVDNPYDNDTAVDGENYWHLVESVATPWTKED